LGQNGKFASIIIGKSASIKYTFFYIFFTNIEGNILHPAQMTL